MTGAPGSLAQRLHAALPQTQCTRCGYPDCMGYAQAMADGVAGINQCPPGGAEGVTRLAALTGRPPLPLDPAHGTEGPRAVAAIDEAWCIGCTLCLDACPTDAILGGNKQMHTVIEPYCTGCELCLPVCPVDCISLENASGERTGWAAWSQAAADQALERYQFHSCSRPPNPGLEHKTLKNESLEGNLPRPASAADNSDALREEKEKKQAVVQAAIARARARQSGG